MTNEFRTTYTALTAAAKAALKAYNAVPHNAVLEAATINADLAIGDLLRANGLAFEQTGKRFNLPGVRA